MSQNINEQLSALLDGELLEEEEELLLRRLESDPAYRETLTRYSLIGELIRDAAAGAHPATTEFSDHVLAALGEDDSYAGTGRGWKNMGKGLVGAGIAAAAAFFAVTSLVGPARDTGGPPAAGLAQAGVSYTVPVVGGIDRNANAIKTVRLTNYLVSHGEFSSAVSRRTMDSRIVRQAPEFVAWKERTNFEDD